MPNRFIVNIMIRPTQAASRRWEVYQAGEKLLTADAAAFQARPPGAPGRE
jgi:hypothetical protein